MPDGAVLTNVRTSTVTMRKDSQTSLGNESIGSSPEIKIRNDEKTSVRRSSVHRQLSKKFSFRQRRKISSSKTPSLDTETESTRSNSVEINDDEVFEVVETKLLLTSAVQRAQSHREVTSSDNNNENAVIKKLNGHSFRSKRPKRSASFRDGLKQGESYQILMLGAIGVGKTSLVNQFQRANHCGSVNIKITNIYGDNCKKSDDTQLVIFDHPATEITAEIAIACCDVDAYVIVYSVTDRSSFKTAQKILQVISNQKSGNKAAILVGNKVDLVRKRVVSTEEGKNVAMSNSCKFIETSDWIDYNVAELFNGVLAQIRIRSECDEENEINTRHGYRRSKTLGAKSWSVLKDFLNLINRKVAVTCDDLQAP
ncbi:GTP binding protein overexpressed in skeletal muscle [Chamberlinius hualienensis]